MIIMLGRNLLIASLGVVLIACQSSLYKIKKPVHKTVVNTKASNVRSIDQFQQSLITEINKIRKKGRKCGKKYFSPTQPLTFDSQLEKVAYKHSLDMSKNNFLDHLSSNGDSLVDRLEKINYEWKFIGENIAHNQHNIQELMEDWLSSPGHCSNIMSPNFSVVGSAQVNWYWTQVYAHPY